LVTVAESRQEKIKRKEKVRQQKNSLSAPVIWIKKGYHEKVYQKNNWVFNACNLYAITYCQYREKQLFTGKTPSFCNQKGTTEKGIPYYSSDPFVRITIKTLLAFPIKPNI
jgi:hypothetical protein